MEDKEAQDALKRVIAIIEAEKVPANLQPTAFEHIWSAIKGGTAAAPPAGAGERPPAGEDTDRFATFAAKLGVNSTVVRDTFELLEDGSFKVQVPTDVVAEGKAAGTRQLAILVCAGRQFNGEDKTPASAIRETCNEYHKYDTPNFGATLRMLDSFLIFSGSGSGIFCKLRRTGWEEAGRLVRELAGE